MGRTSKNSTNRRRVDNLKIPDIIESILNDIDKQSHQIKVLTEEATVLDIIDKVKLNRFLNDYMNSMLTESLRVRSMNEKMAKKLAKSADIVDPKDLCKLYIESKRLETDHLKVVTEFSKLQQFQLSEIEREIIIIYRSLEQPLQLLLYKAILEFCNRCPEIRETMTKQLKVLERRQREREGLKTPPLNNEPLEAENP